MVIVIDTREQRPWSFPPNVQIKFAALKSGDYAIEGDEHFSIERKSADDFVGTLSKGYHRFIRELNRMEKANFCAKVIIVESDWETFCFRTRQGEILPPDHEHIMITPQFLMKRIAQLTMRNVSVLFGHDAELSSALAYRVLMERQIQLEEEIK